MRKFSYKKFKLNNFPQEKLSKLLDTQHKRYVFMELADTIVPVLDYCENILKANYNKLSKDIYSKSLEEYEAYVATNEDEEIKGVLEYFSVLLREFGNYHGY